VPGRSTSQRGDCPDKPVVLTPVEDVRIGTGRARPGVCDALNGPMDSLSTEIELMEDEVVG